MAARLEIWLDALGDINGDHPGVKYCSNNCRAAHARGHLFGHRIATIFVGFGKKTLRPLSIIALSSAGSGLETAKTFCPKTWGGNWVAT